MTLNGLITKKLTSSASTSSTSSVQNQRISKQTNSDSNGWHWKHYHEFKTPNFHDYSSVLNETDDFDDDSTTQITPSNITTKHNWTTVMKQPTTTNGLMKNKTETSSSFDHLAQLSCDSGEMILRLNFSEPFKGIVYPDNNRLSPCRFFGDGHHNYELRLPLRGCGTKQVSFSFFFVFVFVFPFTAVTAAN